ncbi:MAG: 3-oxoacid CoA-transferase subunit B [Desulfovermiculus sp.]|nr:3-oxoacid CoA-transferase subunit B [Desulfovermiculus sp.]MDZ7760673.1 3-oxoacid CoA-transferase subunit B [Desulfovermiculus sp.]
MSLKHKISARAAREIPDGSIINLGIGIPTLIPGYLPAEREVLVHSENGILGMGRACTRAEADRNLIDAGGTYIHINPGGSFFDSAVSFALVRSGRLDVAVLGALEVSETGDVANWIMPGRHTPGIGGGMELAQKANRLLITTTHTTRKGEPKLVRECSLPITARACAHTVITELAVIDITSQGFVLREIATESSVQEVRDKTGAELIVPDGEIPEF